jgi:TRAP-type C4-dicarboxylate transport system permease small subunit
MPEAPQGPPGPELRGIANAVRSVAGVVDRISLAAAALGALCLGLMAALLVSDIGLRWVRGVGLSFSWEYSSYLMASALLLGAAHTLRAGAHVRVSLFGERVPVVMARFADFMCTLAGLAVAAMLASALTTLAHQSWTRGVASFTPAQTPLAVPQTVLAVGAWLLWLQLSARLARLLLGDPPEIPTPEARP